MDQAQYAIMHRLEDHHWWFLAKRRFILSVFPRFSGKIRILDAGCGTGGLTLMLKKFGKVTAVEPSPDAWPFLRQRGIAPVRRTVADCRFPAGSFDLVCFFDVLYHRNIDDRQAVHRASRWLKKGGFLIITDCAFPGLFSRHDRIMQARQRYRLQEMAALVTAERLTVVKATYTYFFLFPFFILSRVFSRFGSGEPVAAVSPFVNQLLLAVCILESRLLSRINFPAGSSILVLARK